MTEFIFPLVLGVVGLLPVLLPTVRWYRQRPLSPERTLREAIRQDIAQVNPGTPVKIVGTLRYAEAPLRAPLTGRECACYQVRVEERPRRGAPNDIVSSLVYKPFFLWDSSGEVYVDPSYVRAVLATRIVTKSRQLLVRPSSEALSLLESHGQAPKNTLGNSRSLDFCEGVLQEGDLVAIYGTGTWEAVGTADYRQKVSRLRLDKNAAGPMLVSDNPKATAS